MIRFLTFISRVREGMVCVSQLLDSLVVLGRIVTILPLLLILGLFMGKRSIGELPVFDFLVVLVLGSVVGADIADPNINHVHTVVAIIAIALLQKLIIYIKMNNRKLGKLLTFEPTIVIYDGQLLSKNLKQINYSIDNVLQMLREKDIFNMNEVELAVIEANGRMSVRVYAQKDVLKREDMSVYVSKNQYDIPLILDGEIQYDLLKQVKKDETWLVNKLAEVHIPDVRRVFLATLNNKEELYISLQDPHVQDPPPIEH